MKQYSKIWYPVAGFAGPVTPEELEEAKATCTQNLATFEAKFLASSKFVSGDDLSIADYKAYVLLWNLNHATIKAKTGFELSTRCQTYVADVEASLKVDTKKAMYEFGGWSPDEFLKSKA